MNTTNLNFKISTLSKVLCHLGLAIILFTPKFDIVPIPGYWQGIRLDDIVIFLFVITLVCLNKYSINRDMIGYNFIVFFPFFVLSMFVGFYGGLSTEWIFIIRYVEYISFIILVNQIEIDKKILIKIIKLFILVNLLVVILQYYGLVGAMTSRGYEGTGLPGSHQYLGYFGDYIPPGRIIDNRTPGITGGPWELGVTLSICMFILYKLERFKFFQFLFYLLISLFMIVMTQTRGTLFAFLFAFLILERRLKVLIPLLTLLILLILFFFLEGNLSSHTLDRYNLDFLHMLRVASAAFTGSFPNYTGYGEVLNFNHGAIEHKYLSLVYRVKDWHVNILKFHENVLFYIFGYGFVTVYTESLILRIITAFGTVGTLIVIFLSRKIPFYFLVFVLTAGITIDLFVSLKIFIFTILLFTVHRKYQIKNIEK